MTKDTRTDIQIYSAIAMLIAGVGLATAGFIVAPTGVISDSVLLFFAQCLIYAGSIFGVSVYITPNLPSLNQSSTLKRKEAKHERNQPYHLPLHRHTRRPSGDSCQHNTDARQGKGLVTHWVSLAD